VVVDATRPVDAVVDDVVAAIRDALIETNGPRVAASATGAASSPEGATSPSPSTSVQDDAA